MSDKNLNENIRLGDGVQSDNGLHVILHGNDSTKNNIPLYPKTMDIDVHIKSRSGFTSYDTLDEVLDDLSDIAFLNALNVTYDSTTDTVTFS